ncbi:6-phosphogluconolactonase [Nitratireductor sp. GISD-1A_MAKvit]|uniref:6-phosphogluconolactonase n=1 Tax=Nitratireductor sp. GISD-1A_MAKvit TaxID=3234198 RepID=UPI0034662500
MKVLTFADRAGMGAAAASDIAHALRERLARQEGVRVIFASAPSQTSMIEQLRAMPGIDWSRVTAFHMDEFIGLAPDAPQRFGHWLDLHIFNALPLAAAHRIDPGADPEAEARRYAALLNEAPIDFVCLGIGVNGHIAFNDPPIADFEDALDVKLVELDAVCRQQQYDDGGFDSLEAVPRTALSLTIPRLLRADRLFCIVPGAHKRDAVHGALHGPLSTACPASILRGHGNCTLYLDKEADPDA